MDSVHAAEITIDALGPEIVLAVKFAYCTSSTGDRMGYGVQNRWSPETLLKLRELLDSMEGDILREIFGEAASSGGGVVVSNTIDGVPGL